MIDADSLCRASPASRQTTPPLQLLGCFIQPRNPKADHFQRGYLPGRHALRSCIDLDDSSHRCDIPKLHSGYWRLATGTVWFMQRDITRALKSWNPTGLATLSIFLDLGYFEPAPNGLLSNAVYFRGVGSSHFGELFCSISNAALGLHYYKARYTSFCCAIHCSEFSIIGSTESAPRKKYLISAT